MAYKIRGHACSCGSLHTVFIPEPRSVEKSLLETFSLLCQQEKKHDTHVLALELLLGKYGIHFSLFLVNKMQPLEFNRIDMYNSSSGGTC